MGYETRRVITLEFEDGDETAFVRFKSMTFADYGAMLEDGSAKAVGAALADRLIEWNFELDGEPIPMTAEGVELLDPSLRDKILREFMEALRGSAANHPLARKSSKPVEAPSMNMEDL